MVLGRVERNPRSWEKELDERDLPIWETLRSSAIFGAYSGGAGLVACSVRGILQSGHPVAAALAGGIHYAGLGMSYSASRTFLLHRTEPEESMTPYISALAGSVSGAAMTMLTRSRAQALPAAFIWGFAGFAGQKALDSYRVRVRDHVDAEPRSIWDGKWSPLQRIADNDYEVLLKEQLLRIDARIAVVDDDLAKLRSRLHAAPPKKS